MTTTDIHLWFPNYGNNPGVVSKLLREQINKMIVNFDAVVEESYFEDFERFVLELEIHQDDYLEYIKKTLHKRFGSFNDLYQLSEGDILLGRLSSPGKVGFGLFVDIGIRNGNKHNDVLIPLYQLRQDFGDDNLSTREIVKSIGLIKEFPLEIEITQINSTPKGKRVNAKFSDATLELFRQWIDSKAEKVLISKTITSTVSRYVHSLELDKFIREIETIDPLTTILHLDTGTNGSGIVPLLGPKLQGAPMGVFRYTASLDD